MRRTKQWWSRLTKEERSELHWLDYYSSRWNTRGPAGLPDGCVECGNCSTPHSGVGLCPTCSRRLDELINKANKAVLSSIVKREETSEAVYGHCITDEERLLSWLQKDRGGKLTSYRTICRYHCLMRNFKGVLQNLIDAGSIRKLKSGYRANKES